MAFPLSVKGSTRLTRANTVTPELVQETEAALIRQGGVVLERSEHALTFRVPFEKLSLWFFDHGTLALEDTGLGPVLHYRASCRRTAAVAGLVAALLGAVTTAQGNAVVGVSIAVAAWMGLFGFHYVAESGRFADRFAQVADGANAWSDASK